MIASLVITLMEIFLSAGALQVLMREFEDRIKGK
jgi:hypothetical protein